MGIKLRAVIFKPDHSNEIFTIKARKHQLEGKKFVHGNCAYLIDDQHFQITSDPRKWWRAFVRQHYTTYYYKQGCPNPIHVPEFDTQAVKDGITSEELAAIFNPWFYRVIAQPTRNLWLEAQFYISVATLLTVLWMAWTLHNGVHLAPTPDPPTATGGP